MSPHINNFSGVATILDRLLWLAPQSRKQRLDLRNAKQQIWAPPSKFSLDNLLREITKMVPVVTNQRL